MQLFSADPKVCFEKMVTHLLVYTVANVSPFFETDFTIFSKRKKKYIFYPWKHKKRSLKDAHNRPKPFISQSSPAHSPQSRFFFSYHQCVPTWAKTWHICLLICDSHVIVTSLSFPTTPVIVIAPLFFKKRKLKENANFSWSWLQNG